MPAAQVLVTGAGGFVGAHVVDRAPGHGLLPVAAEGDLRQAADARSAVGGARPSAVLHLASAAPDPPGGACAALADNALMAANLLAAVADLSPGAPVLVPGSAAQYGLGSFEPLSEAAPLAPVSAYGAMKSALELACTAAEGVRVIWARSFNHLGPGQPPDAPVPGWARQLALAERRGSGALRTGRLDVVRDFLDVRDVADAYLALVSSPAEGPVNVCSGRARALSDVVERLVGLSSAELVVERDPRLARSVDPPHVVGDPSRLRALTGREPRLAFEESLHDVLEEWRRRVREGDAAATAVG